MRTTTILALALLALAGCKPHTSKSSSGTTGRAATAGSSGGGTTGTVDKFSCRNFKCNPPTCCGNACSGSSGCCAGTVCSQDGRCIPEECTACGAVGCNVNFADCTAECAHVTCCTSSCTTNADCCPGTHCAPVVQNGSGNRCFPDECNSCGGMAPICQTSPTDCSVECVAPQKCGTPCTSAADCDAQTECHTFLNGNKYCVPHSFSTECGFCSNGCSFFPSDCHLECRSTPPTTTTTTTTGTVGTTTTGTTGTTGTSGTTTGGTTGGPAPTVLPCCAACTPGSPTQVCASGMECLKDTSGVFVCSPSSARYCDYGSSWTCPPK